VINLPPADHPIWIVIRIALVGVIMFGIVALQLIYRNPFEIADAKYILATLAVIGGFDVALAKLLPKLTRKEDE
jgi:hypothetical protein